MSDQPSGTKPALVLRWVARVWAAVAALFWGAFLVEHVTGWVIRAEHPPPAAVWLALALHATVVVGLLLGWRWDLAGGAVGVTARGSVSRRPGVPGAGATAVARHRRARMPVAPGWRVRAGAASAAPEYDNRTRAARTRRVCVGTLRSQA